MKKTATGVFSKSPAATAVLVEELHDTFEAALCNREHDAWDACVQKHVDANAAAPFWLLHHFGLKPLFAAFHRIRLLEKRLADLEGSAVKFAGTFEAGRNYARNSLVIRKGSSWVALRQTGEDPAAPGCTSWALAAARGKDAR